MEQKSNALAKLVERMELKELQMKMEQERLLQKEKQLRELEQQLHKISS